MLLISQQNIIIFTVFMFSFFLSVMRIYIIFLFLFFISIFIYSVGVTQRYGNTVCNVTCNVTLNEHMSKVKETPRTSFPMDLLRLHEKRADDIRPHAFNIKF